MTNATPVTTQPSTTSPAPEPLGARLQRWLRRPSTITLAGAGCIAIALAVSAIPYGPGSILADYDLQAAILAITAVSLFVTAQFAREATNESRSQFEKQQDERESRRIEAGGRLSLMLAVECARINDGCVQAYRALGADRFAAPWPTWNLPTPVFRSATTQIADLNQAADLIAMYRDVEVVVGQAQTMCRDEEIEQDRAAMVTADERSKFPKLRKHFLLNAGELLAETAALNTRARRERRDRQNLRQTRSQRFYLRLRWTRR